MIEQYALPGSGINGDALVAELVTAGLTDPEVWVSGDAVFVKADTFDAETIGAVVAAHVPPAPVTPPPTTAEEVATLKVEQVALHASLLDDIFAIYGLVLGF